MVMTASRRLSDGRNDRKKKKEMKRGENVKKAEKKRGKLKTCIKFYNVISLIKRALCVFSF